MDSFEKKMLVFAAALTLAAILLIAFIAMSLEAQFGDCQGLKGMVDRVWTGVPCE